MDHLDRHYPAGNTKPVGMVLLVFFIIIGVAAWRLADYYQETQRVALLLPAGARAAFDDGPAIGPRKRDRTTGIHTIFMRLDHGDHRVRISLADGQVIEQTLAVREGAATSSWQLREGKLVPGGE